MTTLECVLLFLGFQLPQLGRRFNLYRRAADRFEGLELPDVISTLNNLMIAILLNAKYQQSSLWLGPNGRPVILNLCFLFFFFF